MNEPRPVYLIDWVAFEEKHPNAFSLAAQCDDVIVGIVGPVYRRVCFCGDMGWEHDADCFVEIGDTP